MKRNKISARWQIYISLLAFSLVLIGILWIFQVVYLDEFYRFIKTKEAEVVYSQVTMLVECGDENLETKIDKIAMKSNMSIMLNSSDLSTGFFSNYNVNSSLQNLPVLDYFYLISCAEENGGTYLRHIEEDERIIPDREYNDTMPDFSGSQDSITDRTGDFLGGDSNNEEFHQNRGLDHGLSMIYVAILDSPKYGDDMVLLVNTVLTPVTSTVETLKIQLTVVTIVLIIMALIIGYAVSRVISMPIIETNKAAKKLAEGDFSPNFTAGSYREICELSDTLNFAAEELGKSEAFQKELIANVSHDLRTPLTMIRGYAEVMRDLPGENTPENVQVIIDESNRLTNLVNDMMDLSKLSAGVISYEPGEYNLTESIDNVLNRYNKLREQEGYIINFIHDESVIVYADEEKIFQVIYNLVNNAVNYTGDDKTVTVKQIVLGDKVRIEVHDSGLGIPEEELKNIWERYYKVDKTHKRSIQGTGIGLSIVKNILKLHGADYGVLSTVGQGSTFWFELALKV